MSQNENSEAIAIQPSSMAPAQEGFLFLTESKASSTSKKRPEKPPVIIYATQYFNVRLFDCFDDAGLALKTWFLPFLTFNSTQKRLPGTINCVPLLTCGWALLVCAVPVYCVATSGILTQLVPDPTMVLKYSRVVLWIGFLVSSLTIFIF